MPRHTNIPAAYLVLRQADQVLLLQRQNTGYRDGWYSLIAGHVDPGESFSQCIIREAKEEANIVLDPESIKVAHVMHRNSEDETERVDIFFESNRWRGELINQEPDKCSKLSWFAIDQLPKKTIPCIQFVFEQIEQNIFYSEYGWT